MSAANGLVGEAARAPSVDVLAPLAVTSAYLPVAAGVAALVARRADVA